MKEIGSGVFGKNCIKCLNVYNDPPGTVGLRADFGCPDTAPHCVNADGSNPKPFWYAGETCTNACPLNKLDYTSGFDCPSNFSPLKLNGNSKCKGTATGYLEFTTDTQGQVGTAFVPFTFSSCNSLLKFTWDVDYSIYGNDYGSADGLALVIHQDPRGTSAFAGSGGSLGVYGPGGITKALVIELDTHFNSEWADNYGDAVHVMRVDASGVSTEIADVEYTSIRTTSGKVKVDYDGARLKIYMNGNGSPTVDVPFNLSTIFTGKAVNVGFAAGTGAEADFHEVHKFKLVG